MMEIKVVKQILAWNEDVSRQVQELLAEKKVCMINVMGSPGAGKTSLITRIIESLRENYRIGVIEGDIAGQIDADKIYAMGIPLGSHDLFLAEVVACDVDESLLDETGKLCLDKAKLIVYSHGEYLALGKKLGTFGYTVRKKKPARKKK